MSLFGKKKENDDEEEEQEVEEETEEYEMNIDCDNCGVNLDFSIPVGTITETFLKDKECEECGCLVLGGKKND